MSNTILISAKSLYKQFGAVTAAKDITVDIEEKTISGLIGTNGAGKTTFVNMLTGYIKPDQGSIRFGTTELIGKSPRAITRLGIARSFQIPQLFNTQTALENVEIALNIAKRPLQEAPSVLERFGLLEYAHELAGIFPEGIRKLLDIALAMVAKPKVLLLDEPTSGVASDEKFAVMDKVMEIVRQESITVLFVEHDMEIVRRYSDNVLAFYEGTVLVKGSPEQVLENAKVREYIIGEPIAIAEEAVC